MYKIRGSYHNDRHTHTDEGERGEEEHYVTSFERSGSVQWSSMREQSIQFVRNSGILVAVEIEGKFPTCREHMEYLDRLYGQSHAHWRVVVAMNQSTVES
jgi:hypothetical protein